MKRICVVGDPRDLASVYITWLAQQKGAEVLELCEDTLGANWTFELDDTRRWEGRVEMGRGKYPFHELNGAFVRLNPQPAVPSYLRLEPRMSQTFVSERRGGLHHFLDCLPFPVVNCPSSGRSNGSKPYQMSLLAKAGFAVPRWTVSNDESIVRDFAGTCVAGTIYKACSGLRSKVRQLDDEVMRRFRLGTSPVVVQEYIPGRDVRIHTVKQRAFATEVLSRAIDYRFEAQGNSYRPTSVPDSIAERCCEVAANEGLMLGSFDFRVTEEERWYCLEMNPVPSFLPYEMSTGQPIGNAVVGALTEPC